MLPRCLLEPIVQCCGRTGPPRDTYITRVLAVRSRGSSGKMDIVPAAQRAAVGVLVLT